MPKRNHAARRRAARPAPRPCVVIFFIAFAVMASGLRSSPGESPAAATPLRVRTVQVLLSADAARIKLRADAGVVVADAGGVMLASVGSPEGVTLWHDDTGRVRLEGAAIATAQVQVRASRGGALTASFERDGEWTDELRYPGTIRVHGRGDETGARLEAINEVELEAYVSCVVANEVWPTFEVEALRAQAIVSRTFVLYQMSRRPTAGPGSPGFDVSATQGSQVYRGLCDSLVCKKASDAAEYTRGIALTYNDRGTDRLFCAYYSAACGGGSQSAALLGPEGDVEPLRGGVICDYCKIAPGDAYRWGPVRMKLDELQTKLLARYPDLSSLGRLTAIAAVPPSGDAQRGSRIVTLRLSGATGGTQDMLAERFRLAVGPMLIRSTDFRVRVAGDEVVFENGKGFGHGLGLCQWGMQGLALAGKPVGDIVRFYFPGSKLTRVY